MWKDPQRVEEDGAEADDGRVAAAALYDGLSTMLPHCGCGRATDGEPTPPACRVHDGVRRDPIIASLQTLLLGQDLARSALRELARLQATEGHASIDAEPGRSWTSFGRARERGPSRPRLRHRRRDAALPRPALRGLAIDPRRRVRARTREPPCSRSHGSTSGRPDGDGFVEYERRVAHGWRTRRGGTPTIAALPRRSAGARGRSRLRRSRATLTTRSGGWPARARGDDEGGRSARAGGGRATAAIRRGVLVRASALDECARPRRRTPPRN